MDDITKLKWENKSEHLEEVSVRVVSVDCQDKRKCLIVHPSRIKYLSIHVISPIKWIAWWIWKYIYHLVIPLWTVGVVTIFISNNRLGAIISSIIPTVDIIIIWGIGCRAVQAWEDSEARSTRIIASPIYSSDLLKLDISQQIIVTPKYCVIFVNRIKLEIQSVCEVISQLI